MVVVPFFLYRKEADRKRGTLAAVYGLWRSQIQTDCAAATPGQETPSRQR